MLLSMHALAQSPLPQTAAPKPPKDFRPTVLRLSYDFVPLTEGLITDIRTGHQFQGSVDFYKYFFVFEYGMQHTSRGNGYIYESDGTFFRLGPEVNLLKNAKDGTSLTFGLRYAQNHYSDEIGFTIHDNPFVEDLVVTEGNPDLRSRWVELTTGLNVNVWKGLYMGYTIRYMVLRKVKGIDDFAPYDVPGFGLYENNVGVGFSYFIGWAIPLRKPFPEEPESE